MTSCRVGAQLSRSKYIWFFSLDNGSLINWSANKKIQTKILQTKNLKSDKKLDREVNGKIICYLVLESYKENKENFVFHANGDLDFILCTKT